MQSVQLSGLKAGATLGHSQSSRFWCLLGMFFTEIYLVGGAKVGVSLTCKPSSQLEAEPKCRYSSL